jgi:hypothetical protein
LVAQGEAALPQSLFEPRPTAGGLGSKSLFEPRPPLCWCLLFLAQMTRGPLSHPADLHGLESGFCLGFLVKPRLCTCCFLSRPKWPKTACHSPRGLDHRTQPAKHAHHNVATSETSIAQIRLSKKFACRICGASLWCFRAHSFRKPYDLMWGEFGRFCVEKSRFRDLGFVLGGLGFEV